MIGGDSAGANLAAVQALDGAARLQVLLYPAVDLLHQDGLYPSIMRFWDGYLLTGDGCAECALMLIPPEQDPADPRPCSPIRADLARAAPALIVAAGFDPLRDQGRAYAMALQKAGVRAHLLEECALRTASPTSPAWSRRRGARWIASPMRSGKSWVGKCDDTAT